MYTAGCLLLSGAVLYTYSVTATVFSKNILAITAALTHAYLYGFIVQVNREGFYLNIYITVTVMEQSLTVLLENFDISIFTKYSDTYLLYRYIAISICIADP